jgi:nicotinamidase/pyrazinamidase
MTSTAFLIVDVQNDFVTGSLPVPGGAAVAAGITAHLRSHRGRYALVAASQDWHDADGDNSGHFAAAGEQPDYVVTWPSHCVAGRPGSDYHKGLDRALIDTHFRKGQGVPAYSMFEGVDDGGHTLADALAASGIIAVDVGGLATDYCVRATALDARRAGLHVRLLTDLVAGVAPETAAATLEELAAAGVVLARSADLGRADES